MAALQLVLGSALILVAALHPDVRADTQAFGVLIALGSGLIGNVPRGPFERGPSRPPPPPLGR